MIDPFDEVAQDLQNYFQSLSDESQYDFAEILAFAVKNAIDYHEDLQATSLKGDTNAIH